MCKEWQAQEAVLMTETKGMQFESVYRVVNVMIFFGF
jgi:hypothetical protein